MSAEFDMGYSCGKRDAELMPSIWWNFSLWAPIGMIIGAALQFLVGRMVGI